MMPQTLETNINLRSTNLQFIRFAAAMLVIISHAFPLSLGDGNLDFLSRFSNGDMTLGGFAVAIFFLVSGFYCIKSAEKCEKVIIFFKKKVLRIFPPLLFVVFVSAFLLGPILTTLSLPDYFSNTETYKYLLNGVLLLQHELPGVFADNIYNATVNGALWTLPVEFVCMIGCFIAYKCKFTNRRNFLFTIPFVIVGSIMIIYLSNTLPMLKDVLMPCLMFYIGIACYIYRKNIVLDLKLAFMFLVLFGLLFCIQQVNLAVLLALPYLLLYVSYGCSQRFASLKFLGDASYEMYLWGFVIQQTIVHYAGGAMTPLLNIGFSILIVIVLALVSKYCLLKRRKKVIL